MKRWTLWLAGAAALVAGVAACPQFAPDDVCGYPGFCGDSSSPGDGGKDAGPDGPVTCPSGHEPKDDPSCVSDALGIFVTPTGNDSNPGTKESPVATVTKALALAKSGGEGFVFVCEGSYTESVDVAQTISIFGGFQCSDWSYSGTQPKFTGAKPDYVFHLSGADDTVMGDLELDAPDAPANTGESSIGAFVANSQNVTFERMTIHAGKGSGGIAGVTTNYTFPDAGALAGNSATGIDGGIENSQNCPGGDTTVGGAGGYGNGTTGEDGKPALDGGLGGQLAACNSGGGGGDGSPASKGVDGAGAATLGGLDASGWQPQAGQQGAHGTAGQGGGGGLGITNGGGGGGGAGGCGGAGGAAGSGGGGSIAIIAVSSVVTCQSDDLLASAAGPGGIGAVGQTGAAGGSHGNGFGTGCSGGNGGAGGSGGAGGGGAGGVSVGVLSKGGTINIDSATQSNITPGTAGAKGTGAAGNDGIDGVSQATLAL